MAADVNLMRGAYMAATGGTTAAGFGKQKKFVDFAIGAIDTLSKTTEGYIDDRSKEFDNAMKELLNSNTGDLVDEDWNLRYNQLVDLKGDYIIGDKRKRAEIMRNISKLDNEQDEHDVTKVNIVDGALNPNGINNNYKGTEQGAGIQGIIDGNTPITYSTETGAAGYMLSNNGDLENFETAKDYFLSSNYLPLNTMEDWGLYDKKNEHGQKIRDRVTLYYQNSMLGLSKEEGGKTQEELDAMFGEKWYSMEEVKDIVSKQSVDVNSRNLILTKAKNDLLASKELTSGNGSFPWDVAYDEVQNEIIGLDTVNKRSLFMDQIIPGTSRTWYKDIQEALMNSNYEDLGIPLTDEEAYVLDPTPPEYDDNGKLISGSPITDVDARKIAREIMKDDDMGNEFLTTYYTKFREQNWNKGATLRKNWDPTLGTWIQSK